MTGKALLCHSKYVHSNPTDLTHGPSIKRPVIEERDHAVRGPWETGIQALPVSCESGTCGGPVASLWRLNV